MITRNKSTLWKIGIWTLFFTIILGYHDNTVETSIMFSDFGVGKYSPDLVLSDPNLLSRSNVNPLHKIFSAIFVKLVEQEPESTLYSGPRVSEKNMVWRVINNRGKRYLSLKNLQTGNITSLEHLFPGFLVPIRWEIYEQWIVFQRYDETAGNFDGTELVAYNIDSDEETIFAPPASNTFYYVWAIDSARVLWSPQKDSCELDLYIYDLKLRENYQITNDCDAQIEIHADLSEDWVVWKGFETNDIHALNLQTNERMRITQTEEVESRPKIDGTLIVWEREKIDIDEDWDIIAYDFEEAREFDLIEAPGPQFKDNIHGNWLHWMDWDARTVFAENIETGQRLEVLVFPEDGGRFVPASNDNRVSWSFMNEGVYLATILEQNSYLPIVFHSK